MAAKARPAHVHSVRPFAAESLRQRGVRIRGIYFEMLQNVGEDGAKRLFNVYFHSSSGSPDVKEIGEEAKRRRQEEIERRLQFHNVREERKKELEKRRQKHAVGSLSPSEKKDRAKNYGRWYLKPEDFGNRTPGA